MMGERTVSESQSPSGRPVAAAADSAACRASGETSPGCHPTRALIFELYQRSAVSPQALSPALRIAAARALVAVLDADESGLAAFGALRHAPAFARQVRHRPLLEHPRLLPARRQEAEMDQVRL